MLHRRALSFHCFIVTALIPDLSDSNSIWLSVWYYIPNRSDAELIRYRTWGLFVANPSVLPQCPPPPFLQSWDYCQPLLEHPMSKLARKQVNLGPFPSPFTQTCRDPESLGRLTRRSSAVGFTWSRFLSRSKPDSNYIHTALYSWKLLLRKFTECTGYTKSIKQSYHNYIVDIGDHIRKTFQGLKMSESFQCTFEADGLAHVDILDDEDLVPARPLQLGLLAVTGERLVLRTSLQRHTSVSWLIPIHAGDDQWRKNLSA